MNKQELIEKINNLQYSLSWNIPRINKETVLELIEQLDEPQKVVVPQFVADWIEVCKEHLTNSLYTAMNPNFMRENNQSFDLTLWIKKTSNQELFAHAWLDGYEVEEEKRYLVKVKGMNRLNGCLAYNKKLGTWYFGISGNSKIHSTNHTRKELEEANFGWVFDCPGIEIKEVE
ncbi:DUF1642 domain-containing protein [Streptococcus oralis subsp. tigurinus]|uniref:DUF1642 domain-containing protein n=1 Tax=Streptococcus oralis TaxID=1303 RepID=UPI0039C3C54A